MRNWKGTRGLFSAMGAALLPCCLLAGAGPLFGAESGEAEAKEPPRVILGSPGNEAARYITERLRYFPESGFGKKLEERNIQSVLIEKRYLYRQSTTEEKLVDLLKQCHVILLTTTSEGVGEMTGAHRRRAKIAGRALKRFVEQGGGLYLNPQPVRYPNHDDEEYWNLVFEPLGLEILHEGVYDKTRNFRAPKLRLEDFFYTHNRTAPEHPVLDGVRCLYLPKTGYNPFPGVAAVRYSDDWTVILRGEKEAKSYKSGTKTDPNWINTETPGTYGSEPPVVAVRTLGKGRIVSYPLSTLFTGGNYGKEVWTPTVETRGDPGAGRPSDSLRLQLNAYRWLAEPALADASFGTFAFPEFKPARSFFPEKRYWNFPTSHFAEKEAADLSGHAKRQPRGVVGAHSSYGGGTGTVAAYVKAAKDAGLSFLVFTDPLEELTEEELAKLKADCKANSSADFYACPGIELTDATGVRRVFYGDNLLYPRASIERQGREYVQWDGKRLHQFGTYSTYNGLSRNGVLDYKQFREANLHPEQQWWFWQAFPFAYDGDKLFADNRDAIRKMLADLRWLGFLSFTRITDPGQVAGAAETLWTAAYYPRQALNTELSPYWVASGKNQHVSQGPTIAYWGGKNLQMETHYRYTRGAQRVWLRFGVHSEKGIDEVRIHDADKGPIRRFAGHGARNLEREFELVHDRHHYLVLEVIDTTGKRAFSHYLLVYCYKQGLYRCSDNLNWLGPTGMIVHPDRNQMFPMAKIPPNFGLGISGYDTGGGALGVPSIGVKSWDAINIQGVGWYPDQSTTPKKVLGKILDVKQSSHNVQVASMEMKHLSEAYGTDERPGGPAGASVPRDLGPTKYFERTHTLYAPMDRTDYFVRWNLRRTRESMEDYEGGLLWHEGAFRFKEDLTLQGDVPMPLMFISAPCDPERQVGQLVIAQNPGCHTRVIYHTDRDNGDFHLAERIRAGGFITAQRTPTGYAAVLVPEGQDFGYEIHSPHRHRIYIGPGRDGQAFKKGDVLRYRYAVATLSDIHGGPEPGTEAVQHLADALNMDGGTDGYPIEMKAGTLEDAVFFFTAKAEENEALFTLGPQDMIIDHPIRVRGLVDNGCAAVYSTKKPWFRFVPVLEGTAIFQEPIETRNEMWVGNLYVADHPAIRLTVVVDGQESEDAPPFMEVHNPTEAAIEATLHSPEHTPVFGGDRVTVRVPAGASVFLKAAEAGKMRLPEPADPPKADAPAGQ